MMGGGGGCIVSEQYHFDTEPGSEKKFVTDPDPDRTLIGIRIQTKEDSVTGKS